MAKTGAKGKAKVAGAEQNKQQKEGKKVSLFDNEEDEVEMTINANYAERYENWRRLEEMEKMKAKYGEAFVNNLPEGDDDEESESSEEEPEWDASDEKSFLKALSALKSGDDKIYDGNQRFFTEKAASSSSAANGDKKSKEKKKEKPVFLKDYERKLVLENQGDIDEVDEEEAARAAQSAGYYEEQEKLKRELKKALADSDGEGENDDGGLLVARQKTEGEKASEEDAYYEWLRGQRQEIEGGGEEELRGLKQAWKEADKDEAEAFLRDYLLNKDYVPERERAGLSLPTYDEIVDVSDDEKELEREKDFERKYNFRFEEPDQEFIKQYPRTVADSLRRPDEKRKEQREAYKERKEREKEEKRQEIRQLKKMKKAEIEAKFARLHKLAGGEVALKVDDLEADFDPKEHDRRMQELFSSEYYSQDVDEEEKPVFSDMSDDDELDYDNMDIGTAKKSAKEEDEEGDEAVDDEDEEEEDEGEKEERVKAAKRAAAEKMEENVGRDKPETRRRRKRNSKFAAAVARPKPLYDPKEKTFEEYFNEYYALDYEDIIGDQITRFKYRQVVPNSFGLSTDEILEAEDRQLNAWASLKKAVGYRTDQEEKFDVVAYERKAKDSAKKQRIFNTDFGGKKSKKLREEDEKVKAAGKEAKPTDTQAVGLHGKVDEEGGEKESKAKRRRNKKKARAEQNGGEAEGQGEGEGEGEQAGEDDAMAPIAEEKQAAPKKKAKKEQPAGGEGGEEKSGNGAAADDKKKSRTRKRKGNGGGGGAAKQSKHDIGVDDARLAAYGINPKKFKNKLKFGKKRDETGGAEE